MPTRIPVDAQCFWAGIDTACLMIAGSECSQDEVLDPQTGRVQVLNIGYQQTPRAWLKAKASSDLTPLWLQFDPFGSVHQISLKHPHPVFTTCCLDHTGAVHP